MKSYDQVIRLDMLRHANRHEGKMADQKSVVEFRENSRDVLAYWLADRIDQLAFLTMSGQAYPRRKTTVPRALVRISRSWSLAPTSLRRPTSVVCSGTKLRKLSYSGATSAVAAFTDLPSWELFVQLKAAKGSVHPWYQNLGWRRDFSMRS